jgi:hypothetical protein
MAIVSRYLLSLLILGCIVSSARASSDNGNSVSDRTVQRHKEEVHANELADIVSLFRAEVQRTPRLRYLIAEVGARSEVWREDDVFYLVIKGDLDPKSKFRHRLDAEASLAATVLGTSGRYRPCARDLVPDSARPVILCRKATDPESLQFDSQKSELQAAYWTLVDKYLLYKASLSRSSNGQTCQHLTLEALPTRKSLAALAGDVAVAKLDKRLIRTGQLPPEK